VQNEISNDLTNLWTTVKSNLKSKNSENRLLQTWLDPTNLVEAEQLEHGCRFKLGVPTELHKYWISENIFDRICSEISGVYNKSFEVELVVTEHLKNYQEEPSLSAEMQQKPLFDYAQPKLAATGEPTAEKTAGWRDMLNPDYTFNTFVVGRNNEFAHGACYAIGQNPGADGYNPLFICGPTGMGKTHLLHAVGNHIRHSQPQLRVYYVSAERFLNECINSIRRNEMDKFRVRYRERCDVLLIDDIQIFGRGESVQEELFNTLNDSFEKGRQVIVASDRMPKDIKGLEDRIRTRLEWGLIADIQMPDIETRVAILRYKAEQKNIVVPSDVITYIARISKRSIRELEGNLNKIKMFSELQGLGINLELAKRVLATHDDAAVITVEDIQKLVCTHYQIRLPDLKSKSRVKPIVTARQMAMYLVKKHLDKSLVDIGRMFGGKDHTTVISALRKIDNELTKNSEIRKDLDELVARIHNITGV
jgi:chromosomal replication initiator protein